MTYHLFPLLIGALYIINPSSAYVVNLAFTTTLTIHYSQAATTAAAAASTAVTFTLQPSTTTLSSNTKSKASCHSESTRVSTSINARISTNPSSPSSTLDPKAPFTNTTDSFPALPLSNNQALALSDFLTLISNIPENLLEAGETGVETFFKDVSSCFSKETKPLISTASAVISKATSLAGVVESKITSAAAPVITKASSVASEIEGKITSAVAPVASKASSIAGEAGDKVSSLLGGIGISIHLARSPPAVLAKDGVLDDIFDAGKCLFNSVSSNPIFDVGKCAADIAGLLPTSGPALLAKVDNIRKLLKDVGGLAKVLAGLAKAGSRADALKAGGTALVQLLQDVTDVGNSVKDCKFLVQ
ncbi:hypothetical protein BGZ60DRAFT_542931 [Tricladium varicosporioides]|nr:hypothetical protein BGZ60DRAFT_542931 [Hymenoscyphus varicosporioides]